MKRLLKILIPSILMLLLIYLLRNGKDIVSGLLFIFPLMYIVMGIICSDFVKELIVSLVLTTAAFLLPVNICFNMGTCIGWALIYIALSVSGYFIKRLITKKLKR